MKLMRDKILHLFYQFIEDELEIIHTILSVWESTQNKWIAQSSVHNWLAQQPLFTTGTFCWQSEQKI